VRPEHDNDFDDYQQPLILKHPIEHSPKSFLDLCTNPFNFCDFVAVTANISHGRHHNHRGWQYANPPSVVEAEPLGEAQLHHSVACIIL
jgi:hypothetical protein